MRTVSWLTIALASMTLAGITGCGTSTPASVAPSPSSSPSAARSTGPTPSPVSGDVKVLLIGYPDQDGTDPATGNKVPGIAQLKTAFEAANPTINLDIINIPWGDGATGYAPKTESMIQAQEACVYQMPGAFDYGHRGLLVDLSTLVAKDPSFANVWSGNQLDQGHGWTPGNPHSLLYLPLGSDERVINWDSKIFQDWGVAPLSEKPTLDEIEQKAASMTGKDPVTGEQTYGYWYQGKYAVWQFMAIAHALGASWGKVNDDGSLTITWNTPQHQQALQWFVKMSKYAPAGALASDAMPQGFLTDQNVVGIIPEGEPGYFLLPLIAQPDIRDRFRSSFDLKGADGKGGLDASENLSMAASCDNKAAAWVVMKWLAGSVQAQQYFFDAIGRIPSIKDAQAAVPAVSALPDANVYFNQPATSDDPYPWAASQPRWSLQAALEAALAGTLTPQAALDKAQKETDDWLKQQEAAAP